VQRATFERVEQRDSASVVRWRFERLMDAGYAPEAASVLADRVEIDLHAAVRLVRRGCPPATAVRILV
jgi:hypothetical protein